MSADLSSAALACINNGVSVIPIDKATKRPSLKTWKPYQATIVDEVLAHRWFLSGVEAFAVIGGQVSGGLLILDFDCPRFYDAWRSTVGNLADGLPVQQTGGGGYQVLLRCPNPGGNDKLAWVKDDAEDTGRTIAIETRGEGGYAVVAPSVHPNGKRYKWLSGDAANIPAVSQSRADFLVDAARKLDEAPYTRQEQERLEAHAREVHERQKSRWNGQASVIDQFNAVHSIETMLERFGYARSTHSRYIRPGGSSESVSVKDGRSCHWSSNDRLNNGHGKGGCGCRDAFDVYSHFEHGGDGKAAVKAAAKLLGMKPNHATERKGQGQPISAAILEPYCPFPVDLLPPTLAQFVNEGAKALGCDPAYIVLPLLAELANAIGNSRRIRLKASWTEPPVLWCVIVGDSGTLKSPAFDLALHPVRLSQKRSMKEYERAKAKYLQEKEQYDADVKVWRKAKPNERGDRPEEPESPTCGRQWCSDTTIEALADRLSNAARGLLVARDELAGWLASFNQYKQGQGGDVAHWLEMHRAGPLLVDRKTGDKTTTFVPRAAVCICGGIQPETLRRCLTAEFYDNGLAARLLLAMPARRVKKWTDADLDGKTVQMMVDLFDELLGFQPSKDVDGEDEPADVPLTDGAKTAWVAFYNQHAQEQAALGGELSAAWSKLEGYAARLALVIHCCRQAAGDKELDPWQIDEQSMVAGVALAKWFGHEAKRVYGVLAETNEGRGSRRLRELIQAKGGLATVRELMRCSRLYADAESWIRALDELVESGIGRWENPKPGAAGGHPAKVFHLLAADEPAVDALTVDGTLQGTS